MEAESANIHLPHRHCSRPARVARNQVFFPPLFYYFFFFLSVDVFQVSFDALQVSFLTDSCSLSARCHVWCEPSMLTYAGMLTYADIC